MKQQFDKYKNEYSCENTTDERKNELIRLMRENLKKRCKSETICCLDNQVYSVDSINVEHLYAIDVFLRFEENKHNLSTIGEIIRQQAQNENKYGPNNPYPSN